MSRVDRAGLAALTAVLLLAVSCAFSRIAAQPSPQGKPAPATQQPVETAVQLPRHSYPVSATVTALFQDDQQFAALAQQVAADLRADLSTYDIRDHATLASYYTTLSNLALERADYNTARAYQDSMRAVEDKPGLRLSAGILERALSAAARPPGEPLDTARFRQVFRAELAALPYPGAEVALMAMKHRFLVRRPLVQAQRIEPGPGSKSLTLAQAQRLIAMRVVRDWTLPVRDVLLAEIDGAMAAHNVADIWPAREVSLEGRTDLTPVTMAIWDSGVDVDVYPGQLFTNPGEIADNGKDDDGNGYIDDVHGIAYDIDKGRVTGMLQPPSQNMGYGHGTQVASVVVRGNPAARMLIARGSQRMGGHGPERAETPPTLQRGRTFAQEIRESVEYFRQHGVRVVNMSWGFNPGGFETTLAAYNIGTPEEQRKLARQVCEIAATALREAIAAAPNILFVAAAGNDDADESFNEEAPASFDLPNVILVGAADAVGGETWFSNHGKVDVFAEGYEVPVKIPGGSSARATGTSIAAPQVTNLAAKLLAVRPTLSVADLRRAILESADETTTGSGKRIKLLNPKAAIDLIVK